MGYKTQSLVKNGKKIIIAAIVVLFVLTIFFSTLITVSIVEAKTNGQFDFMKFIDTSIAKSLNVGENLKISLSPAYSGTFFKVEGYILVLILIFCSIGLIKSMPKNEYTDIEHGSSDWCNGKEQYKILSPNKGILLAEKHYLPVDKRGNVNVLVVGRFWFW